MKCPKCNHIIEEFSPICEECNHIFEYEEYNNFIHKYIEKYSNISAKHNNTINNSKIIFKNIVIEEKYPDIFNNIYPEDYVIEHYKQKGYDAFFAENEYWVVLLIFIYFPEQIGDINRIQALTSCGWLHYFGLNTDEVDIDSIDNISNLNNRIINSYFKSLQLVIKNSNSNNYIKYSCRLRDNKNVNDLIVATTYFTVNQLKLIFERICDDFSYYIYGLPDLIVYNDKEIFFVEVKSKNDSPNFKQIQWHKFLTEIVGINVVIFMMDKTEKKINAIKQKYDVELLNSKNRKISLKKSSSEEICVDWNKIESKYPNFQITDSVFKEFYSVRINEILDSKKICGKYTKLRFKDFERIGKAIEYTDSLRDDLRYEKASNLYQDNSFLDFRPNKKQLKRNDEAKLLEEKGEYSKAIELYMKNAEEKCGSPVTYKRLTAILLRFDKWEDISKLMDFIIPIFIKLNDKKNTLYFIHQREYAYERNNPYSPKEDINPQDMSNIDQNNNFN